MLQWPIIRRKRDNVTDSTSPAPTDTAEEQAGRRRARARPPTALSAPWRVHEPRLRALGDAGASADAASAAGGAATGERDREEVQGDGDSGRAVAAVGLPDGLPRAGRAPAPRVRGPPEGRQGPRRQRRPNRLPPPPRVSEKAVP